MLDKNIKLHPILVEGQVILDTVPIKYIMYKTLKKIF